MRTHYGPWQSCWISNQHQKHKSGRGPSSEHFWQVWPISVQRFQRRFKCEKLTDGRTLTHDKSSHGLWPGELKPIIWPWSQKSRSQEGHYGTWHTALWSCAHIPNIIDISQKKQLFDLEVKVPRRSLRYVTHHLMVMHPHTKYHWPISKDKKCYGQDKKILFKKQLFDLQVKVQRRSLRYATHRLMDMHPHTKYHWPIWKEKSYGPDKLRWEAEEAEEKKSA